VWYALRNQAVLRVPTPLPTLRLHGIESEWRALLEQYHGPPRRCHIRALRSFHGRLYARKGAHGWHLHGLPPRFPIFMRQQGDGPRLASGDAMCGQLVCGVLLYVAFCPIPVLCASHSPSDVCAVCGVSATRSGGDFTTISVDWLGLVEFPRHITNEHSCWNPADCMDICQNLRDKGFTPDACTVRVTNRSVISTRLLTVLCCVGSFATPLYAHF